MRFTAWLLLAATFDSATAVGTMGGCGLWVGQSARNHVRADVLHQKRQLHAVFGAPGAALLDKMVELAAAQPAIAHEVNGLRQGLVDASDCLFRKLHVQSSRSTANVALQLNTKPPDPVILEASYTPTAESRTVRNNIPWEPARDVRWLLQGLVFDSVLRLPTGYNITNLFGENVIAGENRLSVKAQVDSGSVVDKVVRVKEGTLQEDLYISNARPTQVVSMNRAAFDAIVQQHVANRHGLEIGGPSRQTFGPSKGKSNGRGVNVYHWAKAVDQVNFAETTMWGTFKDGSPYPYIGPLAGVKGNVKIMEGTTLSKVEDASYDFVLGSHYLEHISNPLQGLSSMYRVLRPGGVAILILPRKEACFDQYRGQSSIEDITYRFFHKISGTDMAHAHVESFTLQSDLERDAPAAPWPKSRAIAIRNNVNMGVHQFVYDFELLELMARFLDMDVIFKGNYGEGGLHQLIVMRKAETPPAPRAGKQSKFFGRRLR